MMASPSTTGETPVMKGQVPQGMLDPILKEAAALAKLDREQLVIVRAESVVWNDGSLGCPEPGMMYTQALVNGYWVVIDAAGQNYDFRVGNRGSFILCPPRPSFITSERELVRQHNSEITPPGTKTCKYKRPWKKAARRTAYAGTI